jgi:hypothetical protein
VEGDEEEEEEEDEVGGQVGAGSPDYDVLNAERKRLEQSIEARLAQYYDATSK